MKKGKWKYARIVIICHMVGWIRRLDYYERTKYSYPLPLADYAVATDLKIEPYFSRWMKFTLNKKVSPSSAISSPNIGKGHTNTTSEYQRPLKSPSI